MANEPDEPQSDEEPTTGPTEPEQLDEEGADPAAQDAEELINDPEPALRKLRLDPNFYSRVGEGFRALREGMSEFFVASDRGAGRTKDTAERVIDLVEKELDREGLSPQERLEFLRAGERMANQVGNSEKDVRESNERTLTKVVAIAAGAVVGVVVLGHLGRDGKLPPSV